MSVILTFVLLIQTAYTKPAGWVDQKIAGGVTVAAPRVLKKDASDPGINKDGEIWIDDSGPVIYGFRTEKPEAKRAKTVNDALTAYCEDAIDEFEGTVDGEKDLLLQGWRGTALTIKTKNHRTFAVRGYYYQDRIAAAFVAFSSEAKRPESVDQFLDSIRFDAFGTATSAGPDLKRYPVGKTGISALFPAEPAVDANSPDVKRKTVEFEYDADYCGLRTGVKAADLSPEQQSLQGEELGLLYDAFFKAYMGGEKSKQIEEREVIVGIDHGLYRKYDLGDGTGAAVEIVRHNKQVLIFDEVGPTPYLSSQAVDAFFKSIQFADAPPGAAIFAQVQQQKAGAWTELTLSEGIKVSSPVTIKQIDFSKVAPVKGHAHVSMWEGLSDDNGFQFSTFFPKSDFKGSDFDMLNEFLHGMYKSTPGHVEGERNILVQGWQGIAITYVSDQGVTVSTHVIVQPRKIITVGASYPNGRRPDAVDRFLDSLKLPTDGVEKSAEPPMTRFPIGESGMSALFPSAPILSDTMDRGKNINPSGHTYAANYCGRAFSVTYANLPANAPDPTAQQLDEAYSGLLDQVMNGLGGKQTKQKDMGFGADIGLYREFVSGDEVAGSIAVVLHHRQMEILIVVAPKGYSDPAAVDTFFKSLEFKN